MEQLLIEMVHLHRVVVEVEVVLVGEVGFFPDDFYVIPGVGGIKNLIPSTLQPVQFFISFFYDALDHVDLVAVPY